MQNLIIPRLSQTVATAADIPAALLAAGIAYTPVENVNWPESYPYKPKMEFAAAWTHAPALAGSSSDSGETDVLLLHYRVEEQSVRAVALKDHENIWEDACAEFFIMPTDDGLYYNLECNCTGKLLIAVGKDRNGRTPAPMEVMQGVDRWASLGTEPFDTRNEPTKWELCLRVPITTFFRHTLKSFEGMRAKGNVYKCGDNLPVPHFISWNPIKTKSPDFHRPEFFGEMIFE